LTSSEPPIYTKTFQIKTKRPLPGCDILAGARVIYQAKYYLKEFSDIF
jgi:hypothetical protein